MRMKLVWDKADCTVELGELEVVAAPRDFPPFSCQAVVEEQDTHLLLAEQTELKDPGKPSWYLAHTLERDAGKPLGSVLCQGENPLRLLAVVHDLDQEPSCQTESILQAYQAILQLAEEKDLTSLALPLLGTVHGKVSNSDAIRLLREAIERAQPTHPQRLWLILPQDADCEIVKRLSRLDNT